MQKILAFAKWNSYAFTKAYPKGLHPSIYLIIIAFTILIKSPISTFGADIADIRDVKISFGIESATLKSTLLKFQKESGYNIFYLSNKVTPFKNISINKQNRSVQETIEMILKDTPFTYRQEGKTIIITDKEQSTGKESTSPSEPKSLPPISGKVTDEKGENLPGVSVIIKGTQQGTITDENGQFKLVLPKGGATLILSFVGYISEEVTVTDNQTSLSIALKADTKALDEVVIVGYGVQKKTSVTAAVSSMKGEEIASAPITNLSNGLGGRMAGLVVRQNTGEPGRDASNIYIRGVATTGNTQPLLIVDGIPRGFQNLDPNTIESITILKDAAAVAPYGVAGANGVILVTTKRGKSGAPTISYNGYIGFQNPTTLPELPTAFEYATLKNEASISVGGDPLYSEASLQKFRNGSDPDGHPNQNIYDMLFERNTPLTSHNIELSGGVEKVRYYASIGYQYQAGIWKPTNQSRYNYAISIDADVTKSTKVSFSLNGREQVNTAPPVSTDRLFELIHYASPITPILFTNGESGAYIWNNVHGSGSSKNKTTQIYSQLSIEQNLSFIKGLKFRGTFAFDPTLVRGKSFRTPSHLWSVDTTQTPYAFVDGIFEQTKPSLTQSMNYSNQFTTQGGFTYNNTFGKGNIGGLILVESKANNNEFFNATRRNYNLTVDELSMGSSTLADISNSGTSSAARQLGFVYRVTYDYADKYLFEASGRYDGSYYFSKDKRFGFFPAFSVGWRISEEKFLSTTHWIDNLKLRASYGQVGALAGSAFQYLSLYNIYGPAAILDGQAVQAASEGIEANPHITWERANKTNVGIEATLWKGLVKLEADYFFEHRANMLTSPTVVVPVEYGVGLSQVNAGEMQNRGIDLTASTYRNINNHLSLELGTNFTFAKNKLIQVFESSTTYDNPNRRVTGRPLGTRFGYQSLGYFQVEDFDESGNLKSGIASQPWGQVFPGDVRYQDINQDGQIDNNDIVPIGVADIPQIIYGIFSTISYKKFSLDLLFQGAAKTSIYGANGYWHPFNNGRGAYKSNLDYWTPENRDASHARITPSPTSNNNQMSSYLMFNSRYIRLKTINLSYSVPQHISRKVAVENARVFVSGQNLLTFTPIINYDPEIINSQALDYPQQRVVSFGVNLSF